MASVGNELQLDTTRFGNPGQNVQPRLHAPHCNALTTSLNALMRYQSRTMNRGTYWSDKEIKTVIAIWGATDLQQQLDGAVRNKVIYEKIAQEMKK